MPREIVTLQVSAGCCTILSGREADGERRVLAGWAVRQPEWAASLIQEADIQHY